MLHHAWYDSFRNTKTMRMAEKGRKKYRLKMYLTPKIKHNVANPQHLLVGRARAKTPKSSGEGGGRGRKSLKSHFKYNTVCHAVNPTFLYILFVEHMIYWDTLKFQIYIEMISSMLHVIYNMRFIKVDPPWLGHVGLRSESGGHLWSRTVVWWGGLTPRCRQGRRRAWLELPFSGN